MNYAIDQFRYQDTESVVRLWNMLFKNYSLTMESLRKYTLGNPDFDPAGCFVARQNAKVIAFALATVMRIPETGTGELPGCIPVIMVQPDHQKKGIGSALLKKAETYLAAQGKRKIIAGYPTYIRSTVLSLMGVDTQWKEAFWFFKHYIFSILTPSC